MCRLLGIVGKPPLPLVTFLNPFFLLAKEGHVKCTMTPGHLDGWGMAGYTGDQVTYFERRAEPASEDGLLIKLATEKAGRSGTPILLAHLRKASAGSRSVSNTHPFQHRRWLFAHNGTVYGHATLPLHNSQPQGETDSERFMLWMLEQIGQEIDFTAALVKLLRQCRDTLVYSSLTFLLSDGKTLWAYREVGNRRLEPGETMEERDKYYTLCLGRYKEAIVACSEPLTAVGSPEAWRALASRQLAVLKPGQTPKIVLV